MTQTEPIYDVAHLGHVELFTNKPEASLDFFVNSLGLTESGRDATSVYLRAWDDYEFHTLKLTASQREYDLSGRAWRRSRARRCNGGSAQTISMSASPRISSTNESVV